ncbi:hypothetical protein PABG_11283 [Paracoccidioides brasiliensis Pb03]|nr:hypothetical protein PABG_11283 [Paracoccidioides brasiliensis Pb03]
MEMWGEERDERPWAWKRKNRVDAGRDLRLLHLTTNNCLGRMGLAVAPAVRPGRRPGRHPAANDGTRACLIG